jgi:hypothetical protein
MLTKKKKGKALDSFSDCANCGSSEGSISGILVHKFCSRCQLTYYCSKKCQKNHWKEHKKVCIPLESRHVSQQLKLEKRSPTRDICCICLEEMTEKTLKLECGHIFHRNCIQELREKGVQQLCPLCRVKLPDSPEKMFSDGYLLFFQLAKSVNNQDRKDKIAEIIKLWEAAASNGHLHAQHNLGIFYYHGNEIPKNNSKAFNWFLKAANQGFLISQYHLGFMYQKGEGVSQSLSMALRWYHKSAEQGYTPSYNQIGGIYNTGPKSIQNYDLALQWYRKGAQKHIPESQYNLGNMYLHGKSVDKNITEAGKWYLRAAKQGHSHAQFYLGLMFQNGEGVPQNDSQAVRWIQQAAEQGLPEAQNHLGVMYITGTYVSFNQKKALEYLNRARKQGFQEAEDNLIKIMGTILEDK